MQDQAKIFHEQNVTKALIRFAIPGVLTLLMAELYNMVDTFFVGRYISDLAIGALGIAFPIQRFFIALSLLIGVGTSTLVGRSLGEGSHEKMEKAIGNALLLGSGIFTLLPLLVFCFRRNILQLLGAGGSIYPLSDSYVKIILLGSFFLGFTNILGYSLTALGYPKVTLIATSIGSAVNILMDYLLVGQIHMGIEGAAVATVLSQILGFAYAVHFFCRVKKSQDLTPRFKGSKAMISRILAVGFATFIVEISDAVLIAALNQLLARKGGDDALVMVGAITRISMFLYITMLGISSGMQPLAAFFYGSNDQQRLKAVVKSTSLLSGLTSLILWTAFFLFTPQILGSFLRDTLLLDKTVAAFRLSIIVFPVISIYYVSIYYYQAIGWAMKGFALSIYRQLLLFIPLLYLLVDLWGIQGAWITYPITDAISGVTGVYVLWKGLNKVGECEKGAK